MIAWKYQIGEIVQDDKRHFVITDRQVKEKIYRNNNKRYSYKLYKYQCFECGWDEGWIEESNLVKGHQCRCCIGQVAIKGINTLGDKRPDLIRYLKNPEDAFRVLPRTCNQKIDILCPLCNNLIKITPDHLSSRGFTCRKCNDGISYPEKFVYCLLQQMKVKFYTQLNSSHFSWVGNFRYDFYLPDYKCVIETHGDQHYNGVKDEILKKIQNIDKNKKELAEKNDVKYIVIDCRKSTVDWIKNSLYHSPLSSLFDLSNIDWQECHKYSVNSLVKTVSDCWNNHNTWSVKVICDHVGLKKKTVVKYLKQAKELGWCDYTAELSYRRRTLSATKSNAISVNVYKDDMFLKSYNSAKELYRKSKQDYGTQFCYSSICEVCRGVTKSHHGYIFKYIKDENDKK